MSTFYDSPYTIWNDKTAGGMTPLPIVYLHSFKGNGEDVWKACHGLKDCPPMVLVSVNNPVRGWTTSCRHGRRTGCGRAKRRTRDWRRSICAG